MAPGLDIDRHISQVSINGEEDQLKISVTKRFYRQHDHEYGTHTKRGVVTVEMRAVPELFDEADELIEEVVNLLKYEIELSRK